MMDLASHHKFIFTAALIVGILFLVAVIFFFRYSISKVAGSSMEPELYDGDIMIVDRRNRKYVAGEIVVLFAPTGRINVKRISQCFKDAWDNDPRYWVLGDNRDHSMDSREYGAIAAINILGKVVFTWKRKKSRKLTKTERSS
ncbi:signal peptidase I [compost metagenome]